MRGPDNILQLIAVMDILSPVMKREAVEPKPKRVTIVVKINPLITVWDFPTMLIF